MQQPSSAVIAITLNCNSRCLMCNIWKNKIGKEITPDVYKKLPKSLKDINISGGEPFLRQDLPEIIKVIKTNNPNAKLIINTNGLLTKIIENQIDKILTIDKNIGVRVSIDGWKQTHDTIRGTKNAFSKSIKTINLLKNSGIKDLGLSFTILDQNYKDLPKIYNYCKKNKIQLSLTLVSSSPIYFGKDKQNLQPKNKEEFKKYIQFIYIRNYLSLNIKNNFRAWFEEELYNYYLTKKRRFSCNAGSDFFLYGFFRKHLYLPSKK